MLRHLLAALAIASLLLPSTANAYGRYAHATIADIAMANVRPATRAKVRAMLAKSALLETPTCRAATPEDASVWPDCIRGMGLRFNYSAPWHYQTIDICKPFDLESACANGNCVSAQIDRDVKLLQDSSIPMREKVAALAFLIHFVGDMHMPLHSGNRQDRGGNAVKAAYGDYESERLNLHSIWDGALAERAISTPPSLVRSYTADEKSAITAGTTADWAQQAWQVARDVAYAEAQGGDPCGPPQSSVKLSNDSINRSVDPQRLQVERAGLRLARLLDEAFDPANAYDSRAERRRQR